jgi:hypothetical protein
MGRFGGRLTLAVALTTAAIGMLGTTPATAGAAAQVTEETRPTTLVAGHPKLLGLTVSLKPAARLTDGVTGQPLAGLEIQFWPNGDAIFPLCEGITDAQGIAKCGGPMEQWQVLVGRGYEAVFSPVAVGDIWYELSRDRTRLLGP